MAETNTFTIRALLVELDRVIEQRRRVYAGLVASGNLRQSAVDCRLGAMLAIRSMMVDLPETDHVTVPVERVDNRC